MLPVCRRTPLHCAAYGGFSDCVSTLLEEGKADVNGQDCEGITALHWACSVGHMDTIQQLLSAGANPNLLEVDGERLAPLDYAIIGGHQEAAQVLIEQGALSISSIQQLAAVQIQKCVRGYLVRRRGLLTSLRVECESSVLVLPPAVSAEGQSLDRRRY